MARATYTIKAMCSNCGWGGFAEIKEGVRVGDSNCPRCVTPSIDRTLWLWPWQAFNRKALRSYRHV